MEPIKPKRGRPRNKVGDMKARDFMRAGMLMSAYDEARRRNEKHSVGITEAAELGKQRHPEMPISEACTRRALATFRPRKSRTVLLFEGSMMSEPENERLQEMWKQARAGQQALGGFDTDLLPDPGSLKPKTKYTIRIGDRPNYPRHNAKKIDD